MREFLTDRNFIKSKILLLSKIILICALFIFFLPLIILPFFNHPFADDYVCGYYLNSKGFTGYQSFIYLNWSGRYSATFAGSLFAYDNFLYNHYYFHSLLLLLLSFSSIFFLVDTLDKYVLKEHYNLSKKILTAVLFLALEICSLPQCSTFLFWFSSAITYQLPVILFQIEVALLIWFFNSNNKAFTTIYGLLLPVFVFVIIGFNELFIVLQLLLFGLLFYFKLYAKNSRIFIVCMILAFISGSALLIFAPGNQSRVSLIHSKSVPVGLFAIAYEGLKTLWSIFKNPYTWFVAVAIVIYANQIKDKWQHNFYIEKIKANRWLVPAMIFVLLMISVSLPVIALRGGLIPDRYLNAVACFILLLLLPGLFISGIDISSKIFSTKSSTKSIAMYFLLATGLLCNTYITDAYKSIIIAPVYNTILNEKEAALKQASKRNKVAEVKEYNTALSELLKTKYSSASATFQELIRQKPSFLFFEENLSDNYSLAVIKNYYKLDSIIIKKQ